MCVMNMCHKTRKQAFGFMVQMLCPTQECLVSIPDSHVPPTRVWGQRGTAFTLHMWQTLNDFLAPDLALRPLSSWGHLDREPAHESSLSLYFSGKETFFFNFIILGLCLTWFVSSLARMLILYPSVFSFSSVTSWVGVPRE